MDYLTRYYKNLSEQLQERLNYLILEMKGGPRGYIDPKKETLNPERSGARPEGQSSMTRPDEPNVPLGAGSDPHPDKRTDPPEYSGDDKPEVLDPYSYQNQFSFEQGEPGKPGTTTGPFTDEQRQKLRSDIAAERLKELIKNNPKKLSIDELRRIAQNDAYDFVMREQNKREFRNPSYSNWQKEDDRRKGIVPRERQDPNQPSSV